MTNKPIMMTLIKRDTDYALRRSDNYYTINYPCKHMLACYAYWQIYNINLYTEFNYD